MGGQVSTTFVGNGGSSVGNVWNKLLYATAWFHGPVLLPSQTNEASRSFRPRPSSVSRRLRPTRTLEQSAYPAVVDMDGDSSTPLPPCSGCRRIHDDEQLTLMPSTRLPSDATVDSRSTQVGQYVQANKINYMRNSVKAVVDAYDGSVRLFRWEDDADPILRTWEKIYPGSVEPISSISGDLMSHLRYPEDMFKVQRNLLATYHVTDASGFYSGGDRGRLAEET